MDVTGNLFDKAGAPLTITMTDLPSGLTCDPATGTVQGTIAGGAYQHSPYQVSVQASDGIDSTSSTIIWLIYRSQITLSYPYNRSNYLFSNSDGNACLPPLTAKSSSGSSVQFTVTGLPPGIALIH